LSYALQQPEKIVAHPVNIALWERQQPAKSIIWRAISMLAILGFHSWSVNVRMALAGMSFTHANPAPRVDLSSPKAFSPATFGSFRD
jgi:hypothetical protein